MIKVYFYSPFRTLHPAQNALQKIQIPETQQKMKAQLKYCTSEEKNVKLTKQKKDKTKPTYIYIHSGIVPNKMGSM